VRKRLYWLELNAMKDCSLFVPISNYSMYIIYLVTSRANYSHHLGPKLNFN